MKAFFIFLFALFSAQIEFAQDWSVPEDYVLKEASDYAKYEEDIIEAAKWLEATPFGSDVTMHRLVSKFVIDWVNGSPTVNVEINPTIMDFDKKNPGMLVLYMAASARYVLENDDPTDMRAKHKFALRSMMKAYQKDPDMKKDKNMDKLIEADKAGEIDAWLDQNLKIDK